MKRKQYRPILITLFVFLLLTMISASAFCATGNPVTDFTEGLKNTFRSQEAAGQSYLGPFLAVTAVLLALIIFLVRDQVRQIKNKSVVWNIDFNEPGGGPHKQRRAWFRLPLNQYFLYAQDDSGQYEITKTINISGGGLLFATDEKPDPGEKIRIHINIAREKKLILNGKVVWVSENPEENQGSRFLVGMEFIDIKAGEQDSIVGQILEKQQTIILESKRKANHECVRCGLPLPDEGQSADGSLCSRCVAPAVKIKARS